MNIKKFATKGLILALIMLPQVMQAMNNEVPAAVQPSGFWTSVKNAFISIKNIPSTTFSAVKTASQFVISSTKTVFSGIASCPEKIVRGVKYSANTAFEAVKNHPIYTLIGAGSVAAVSYVAWKLYKKSKEISEPKAA